MLILNPAHLLKSVKNTSLPAYYALPVYKAGESMYIISDIYTD